MNLFIRELRKLLALTKADPKSLAAGIIAPTVILVIFALTFGNFVALKLAVVNDDAGAFGAAFEETVFSQTSPLSGEPYFEAIEADAGEAQELYEQGRVNGILTIPEDFSERLGSGDPAQVLYAFDNYNTDMAKNLRLYLDEGIFAFYQEHMPGMEIEVRREFAVGTQLDWFAIIAVGVFMLAFLMGSMFNFLYLLNKERVHATLSEYRLAAHVRGARRGGASRRGGRSGGERAAHLAAYGCESGMRHLGDPARPFGAGGCVRVVRGDRLAYGAQVQRRRDAVDGDRRGGVVPLRRHDLGEVRHGRPARRGARPALELRPFPDPRGRVRRRPERRRPACGG